MNRRRKAAPDVDVQQKPCIPQQQSTVSRHGHHGRRSSISSNRYCNVDNDHDSAMDSHDEHGTEQHGYRPRACIKSSDKWRYSSMTTTTTATTTATTTKQRFTLTALRNSIVRTILQQQKNFQPLVLMLFIPICLWINAITVSSSSSSSSFFHNQFQWTKHYPDAPFRPRMLQLQLQNGQAQTLEGKSLKQVTRLVFEGEDVILQPIQQRQQQQRALQKSTTRKLDSYWYNHGQVKALNEPDDMRTRDTCVYLADWQHAYHPSCNDIHAVDLASTSSSVTTTSTLINHGAYRYVWKITDNNIRTSHDHDNGTSSQQQASQQPQYRVLKTLRYHKRRMFDLRNFDRHRRDAMAFQELQSSKHVMDIYGHCANSALFDYSDGGDLWGLFDSGSKARHGRKDESLEDDTSTSNSTTSMSSSFLQMQDNNDEQDQDEVEPKPEQPTKFQLLQIAHSIASAVADAHHVDALGRPTMAHTDIKPDQWILVSSSSSSSKSKSSSHNGTSSSDDSKNEITTRPLLQYQLGDFNRARFLTWDTVNNETCPFHVNVNGGPWRSPEEYNHANQTEKGDIWSLGNVLYFLISGGKSPFYDLEEDEAIELVKMGRHPTIDEYYHEQQLWLRRKTSNNATNEDDDSFMFLDVMGKAMMSCFEFDPKKRPSAHQIVAILEQGLVTWTSNKKRKKQETAQMMMRRNVDMTTNR